MTSEAAQKELLRITDELEKRICSDATRPQRVTCIRLIDDAIVAVENVAKACAYPEISSLVHDQLVWILIWLKRVYGWQGK